MCHLPVHHCTDPPSGAAYSNVQVALMKSDGLGSRACIPTCLPVAHEKKKAHCYHVSVVLCLDIELLKS